MVGQGIGGTFRVYSASKSRPNRHTSLHAMTCTNGVPVKGLMPARPETGCSFGQDTFSDDELSIDWKRNIDVDCRRLDKPSGVKDQCDAFEDGPGSSKFDKDASVVYEFAELHAGPDLQRDHPPESEAAGRPNTTPTSFEGQNNTHFASGEMKASTGMNDAQQLLMNDSPCNSPSFFIPGLQLEHMLASNRAGRCRFWSWELYRDKHGRQPRLHYCKTLEESERCATLFLGSKVVGFDMEWRCPSRPGIKNNASLLQVANETDIGLFHIALHKGTTPAQLVAPTLKRILENPDIRKTGVNIVGADGARLKKYLHLEPRGLFVLSDLHKALKAVQDPDRSCTGYKRLVALAKLTKEHLFLPLAKGKVRTSDWSKPLTPAQIRYSANDAYAGFKLFQVMDMELRQMDPALPLPAHPEPMRPLVKSHPESEKAPGAAGRFRIQALPGPQVCTGKPLKSCAEVDFGPDRHYTPPDAFAKTSSRRLLSALTGLRIQLSRKAGLKSTSIASDWLLQRLPDLSPQVEEDCASVLGFGAFKCIAAQHGVSVIDFVVRHGGH